MFFSRIGVSGERIDRSVGVNFLVGCLTNDVLLEALLKVGAKSVSAGDPVKLGVGRLVGNHFPHLIRDNTDFHDGFAASIPRVRTVPAALGDVNGVGFAFEGVKQLLCVVSREDNVRPVAANNLLVYPPGLGVRRDIGFLAMAKDADEALGL